MNENCVGLGTEKSKCEGKGEGKAFPQQIIQTQTEERNIGLPSLL